MVKSSKILPIRTKDGLEIWLSKSYLLDKCEGLTDGYLRVAMTRKKAGVGTSWRSQKINNETHFEYSSIPKGRYYEMLPTLNELLEIANQSATSDTTLEVEARQFINNEFSKYLPYYNNQCTAQQAINLAKSCAMLEWILKYIDDTQLDLRGMDFFKTAGEIIGNLEIKYLPEAHRNLKYKVMDILSANSSIIDSVKLPRAGNDYAALHREDKDVMSWIYELRSSGKNYTNAFIIRKVQQECDKLGKPVPSDRWIGDVLGRHETKFLTAEARFGSGKYANPYKSSIPTANALFAGDCWEIDATRVNVIPHKNSQTKEKQYLTIVAVRDVHSGCPVGIAFDVSENRWVVAQALSNAVAYTGYLPYEIRHDRFPGHNTEEVKEMFAALKSVGVHLTPVHKSTGKQRLERWFGSMQHLALQESPFYYGEGIMSNRKTAHRSKEYMTEARKIADQNGWDFDKAAGETLTRITSWVNTPYSQWSRKYKHIKLSPVQMHEQSEKPNVFSCNEALHAYLFGLKKTLQIRNSGLIHTTINHEEFIYQIEDYEVIKKYSRVICCYDVEDLSKVHIYAPGAQVMKMYLGVAKEFVPPQLYGTNPEYGRLAKIRAMYSEFDRLKQEDLQAKKVANGEMVYGADYTVAQPMTVSKPVAEQAETQITNKHFGFDGGEDFDNDVLNQL